MVKGRDLNLNLSEETKPQNETKLGRLDMHIVKNVGKDFCNNICKVRLFSCVTHLRM